MRNGVQLNSFQYVFCYHYLFLFLFIAVEVMKSDPCNPSPCGPNANCNNGVCTCVSEYHGNPYVGCQPECVQNYDCPKNRACIRNKCVDPCPGVCGQGAQCNVINHQPSCSCPAPLTGDPFVYCKSVPSKFPFEYSQIK